MSLTLIIVIITGLISYQAFNNRSMMEQLKHYPYAEARNKEYFRFLSSGFIHNDWVHLLINMFVLYSFGEILEQVFLQIFGEMMGRINYLLLYLFSIVFASIPSFLKHRNNPSYGAVGASGAVSAVLFSFLIFYPWEMIYLYAIIPIPGIVAGLAYLAYSHWASKNRNDNIGHDAHFYGSVFGFLFTIVLQPSQFSAFLQRLVQDFPL